MNETAAMAHTALSEQTKQHLAQERSRLVNDREKIVSEVKSSVSAEVDRVIQTLNALLGELPAVEAAKQAKPEAKEQSKLSQGFDAKQLKHKFKDMNLSAAIVQILQQDPTREYETDALIAALYDSVDQAEMPRARKTLGATLMHQRRAGVVEKIGDKSPRYKLGQAAAVTA